MDTKKRVLFICVHNAARSQMAEAFLNFLGNGAYEATSAGLEPTVVNPVVVDAMLEVGYDIGNKKTRSVFDLFREGRLFDAVITVCKESVEERCPVFPGVARRLKWEFDDPGAIEGAYETRLAGTERIRDQIREKIETWLREESEAGVSR